MMDCDRRVVGVSALFATGRQLVVCRFAPEGDMNWVDVDCLNVTESGLSGSDVCDELAAVGRW